MCRGAPVCSACRGRGPASQPASCLWACPRLLPWLPPAAAVELAAAACSRPPCAPRPCLPRRRPVRAHIPGTVSPLASTTSSTSWPMKGSPGENCTPIPIFSSTRSACSSGPSGATRPTAASACAQRPAQQRAAPHSARLYSSDAAASLKLTTPTSYAMSTGVWPQAPRLLSQRERGRPGPAASGPLLHSPLLPWAGCGRFAPPADSAPSQV